MKHAINSDEWRKVYHWNIGKERWAQVFDENDCDLFTIEFAEELQTAIERRWGQPVAIVNVGGTKITPPSKNELREAAKRKVEWR